MRLIVKLTPGANKNTILGWDTDAEGEKFLKVHVTAVAEKGKANLALIKILSKHWKIPKSSIAIIRGETSRIKTLEIEGILIDKLYDSL